LLLFSENYFSSGERDSFDVSGRTESHRAQFHRACDYRKDDRLGGSVRDSFQSDEDGSGICGRNTNDRESPPVQETALSMAVINYKLKRFSLSH
jgi:hypothetical protein